ncbi:MAG: PilN domain-containing protein [Pseudanabaena sp.]|jgi:type IV pilus assembly protein PilN|nr:PilN domain-containing protein [Pseudanabaena sp. M090S1SP2A07QC]MCA6505739.1 PilN domain-containing protein [Pseudanabaena sp. M172S2SP2A07QC]MCA6509186.1 PilN domain-containing protein [Pseudanabaena sp. M109S1SP2A07QC]MCA6520024.1 PilN domain-containing protein [Pseudanabaena sp. M110S1SP2A07QC]MCA6521917.1 PilN domain-containing protein [Pseudanabaena sp. M051S1SP2A07QC]MCA6524502.1 PilN domain-containing protein [Pseudanabaena sp. M179S2SP2A07QC]MCA6528564.1 PilN domain-containing pro
MYTLDINFLSDRTVEESQALERQPIADSQFLVYGGAAAVVALAIVGGAFLVLNSQNGGIKQKLSVLTAEESQLNSKLTALKSQETELQAIQARTGELVNLFVGNLPVSAIADDIRKRTPITVQVEAITQATAAATAQSPAGSTISLTGKATSYNELNDFLLLLKASPLLEAKETVLVSSALQPATTDKNFTLVNFQIRTAVTTKSPADILPALQKTGADGLVTRVNLLKQQGVIK